MRALMEKRAPDGFCALTVFVGGMRQPELARLSTSKLMEAIEADLEAFFGIRAKPDFIHHTFWEHAIPQYTMGYGAHLRAIRAFEKRFPGLYLIGNYRGGVSLGHAMMNGFVLGERANIH